MDVALNGLPGSVRQIYMEAIHRHGARFLLDHIPRPGLDGIQDPLTATIHQAFLDYKNHASNCSSVRVYYLSHVVAPYMIPRFLTDVPAVCVNGDKYIRLQNKDELSIAYDNRILLNYEERRISRKKVLASVNNVYAYGGYRGSVFEYRKVNSKHDISGM